MKRNIAVLAMLLINTMTVAKEKVIQSLDPEKANISVNRVVDFYELEKNQEQDITVRLISEYTGGSTDFSKRMNLYLTFVHAGEESDAYCSFLLGDAYQLISAIQTKNGNYEITVRNSTGFFETWTVNAEQVWADDSKLAVGALESIYFHSKIKMTIKKNDNER